MTVWFKSLPWNCIKFYGMGFFVVLSIFSADWFKVRILDADTFAEIDLLEKMVLISVGAAALVFLKMVANHLNTKEKE